MGKRGDKKTDVEETRRRRAGYHTDRLMRNGLANRVELLESGETRLMAVIMLVHSVVGDPICGVNHNLRSPGEGETRASQGTDNGKRPDEWVNGVIKWAKTGCLGGWWDGRMDDDRAALSDNTAISTIPHHPGLSNSHLTGR